MRAILFALLLLTPTLSNAQILPGGSIHLAWDDCYNGEAGGSATKNFACDNDAEGPFELFASVVPPAGITQYVGSLAVFDLQFTTTPLPDWWAFGQCRPSNSITAAPAAGQTSCADLIDLPQFGGMDYALGFSGQLSKARLRTAYAIDQTLAGPLQSTDEVTVIRIAIAGDRTVGPTACAGCSVGLCIVFNSLLLDQVDPNLPRGLVTSGPQQFAYWNASSGYMCYTPSVARTWGQLKSLYR